MTSRLFFFFVFTILFVIPYVHSLRCWNNCTFQGLHLNTSVPSDLCTSLNQSNNDTDQTCQVKLTIDPIQNLVNGSFISGKRTILNGDHLLVRTHFPLNDSSVIINIDYTCSVNDYCDIEFVRETLSSAWNKVPIKSIHKQLVSRLYDPNNTDVPVQCSNNNSCSNNTTYCFGSYVCTTEVSNNNYFIDSECTQTDEIRGIIWRKRYFTSHASNSINTGTYFCNKPHCASDTSIGDTFQWLDREYILPLNISVVNFTTTRRPTTTRATTLSSTRSTTTRRNNASFVFGFCNSILLLFLVMIVLQQNIFHRF
ncbi:unnamed protein product [Adineta ricciae]|uniref:Uncharacterized protein n=1 Tax=Adineta ricciae TaxID=249248 RepID=A0A814HB32_ADIRI|nr:unnamed protein product [Adineta ricciae]CAF1249998.1 unnamed protein product [Adineta ricciae]